MIRWNSVCCRKRYAVGKAYKNSNGATSYKPSLPKLYGKVVIAALAVIPVVLLGQNLAPAPPSSSAQAELSKVEQWVLSQGTAESIAPELAAILGLGSDRLPVKTKSFPTKEGITLTFAVSTNPKQEGIVISALKTIADKTKIYSVGNAWLTDRSGILRQTIEVDASGAKVLPNSSHAAKFKEIKAFFVNKLQATSPSGTLSPSPRISATVLEGKGASDIQYQIATYRPFVNFTVETERCMV